VLSLDHEAREQARCWRGRARSAHAGTIAVSARS
jgi:hypothetical protein